MPGFTHVQNILKKVLAIRAARCVVGRCGFVAAGERLTLAQKQFFDQLFVEFAALIIRMTIMARSALADVQPMIDSNATSVLIVLNMLFFLQVCRDLLAVFKIYYGYFTCCLSSSAHIRLDV
jgi:hypothetical protein